MYMQLKQSSVPPVHRTTFIGGCPIKGRSIGHGENEKQVKQQESSADERKTDWKEGFVWLK
jgi:hypothetical protein